MKKKSRIKRKIVIWQTKDQGANPLTSKGRKYIKKEIKNLDIKKLRRSLETQSFKEDVNEKGYWDWMESKGYFNESFQANPDFMNDDLENTVDGGNTYE